MEQIRRAAVAGRFYPLDPEELRAAVEGYIAQGARAGAPGQIAALVGPHAGYVYSGPVAGVAYRALRDAGPRRWSRVVLLGPSHYVPFTGIASPDAEAFETPLGTVALDVEALGRLEAAGLVACYAEPHRMEHGLEVHLPFLQVVLGGDFKLVPLVVGQTSATHVAKVLEEVWGGAPDVLVVISSDLSHYLSYEECRKIDAQTCAAIEQLDEAGLGPAEACGWLPLRGALRQARGMGLRVSTLDLRCSGDTAGGHERVVGYGAWIFSREPA